MELRVASLRIVVLTQHFMLNLLLLPVAAQSTEGFVSIDCGGHGGRDSKTSLDWTTDAKYLQGAQELAREGVTINANVTLAPTTRPIDNEEQLRTAMIFYPGNLYHDLIPRSKYCYELPVYYNASEGTRSYLLRATFPSRNLTTTAKDTNGETMALDAYSTRFYFSIDTTYVSTVELDEDQPQTIEIIINPLNATVYVCLVPLEDRSSMPAISALELRPFKDGMYRRSYQQVKEGSFGVNSVQATYLVLFYRLNFGADPDSPSVRYPDDNYDRVWMSPRIPSGESSQVTSRSNTTIVEPGPDGEYDYPVKVYSTAWVGRSVGSEISFQLNLSAARIESPTPTFYMNLFFFDLLDSSNATRSIDIDHDPGNGMQTYDRDIAVNNVGYYMKNRKRLTFISDNVTFLVRTNGSSELPALINGVEIYGEFDPVISRTFPGDAGAIGNVSQVVIDKSGDPCLPVPWAWIVCSVELPPHVTHVNMTKKGVSGELPFFHVLDRLTVLDLSNNNLSGRLPLSLGNASFLRALNLESNNLSGELPPFRPKSFHNLESLSLANNQLSGSLFSLVSAVDTSIFDLRLSRNSFSGPLPSEIEQLPNLQNLDISFNRLSGELTVDMGKLTYLQNLNMNGNDIEGTIPDSIWSSFSLKIVNLDGNRLTEVNLTTWYISVTKARSFDDYEGRRKVRLVGNPIQNIILPSLESSILLPSEAEKQRSLENPAAFILVGEDSPWCKEYMGRPNTTLITRYLCRSDEHRDFWFSPAAGNGGVSSKTLIIVGVVCGLLVSIMAAVFIFLLWRMRRRSRELHQIQDALAKENVKPPFFHYEELKMATHNFSKSSILGTGGFGTVYKAEFADGKVLAVKRLNPTEQNTTDFLNEVVNITGIKHRHLIQLKGCCVRERQQRMLVYEFADNKNLAEALWGPQKPSGLSWKQRFNICLGIARGLAYLHEELHPKMVHRDIKPQNILLDHDYNAKIADFGLVRPTDTFKTEITLHIGGTRGYWSPEYLNEGVVSEKLDVYSFGIVLLEIVSGRKCIRPQLGPERTYLRTWALELYEEKKLLNLVDPELMEEYNKEEVLLVLETALACCQVDPKKRPTMSQVVNMLVKHTDAAIDIVRELRDQKPQLKNIREEDMESHPMSTSSEEIALFSPILEYSAQSMELSNIPR